MHYHHRVGRRINSLLDAYIRLTSTFWLRFIALLFNVNAMAFVFGHVMSHPSDDRHVGLGVFLMFSLIALTEFGGVYYLKRDNPQCGF